MTLNHARSSHPISLNTAAVLTGRSTRTWQRCIAEGQVPRLPDNRKHTLGALIPFEAVRPWLAVDWLQDDVVLLVEADQGHARSQAEIGAWFALSALRPTEAGRANQKKPMQPPSGGGGGQYYPRFPLPGFGG